MTDVDSRLVEAAVKRIERNGGKVFKGDPARNKVKTFSLGRMPGIKVLGAGDCLANYGGYRPVTGNNR